MDILTKNELPAGFEYPPQYLRLLRLGIVDMEPWYLLRGNGLRETVGGLKSRYPHSALVPFARRQDNDDIACWEVGSVESVYIIHDFAEPGWERRARYENFWDWFRKAIDDFILFDEL